jgi:DNA-binding response OmpR family regulator
VKLFAPVGVKTVLLVDSDARSLRVLEVSLKRAGFEVATAKSFEDALSAASRARPEIIVTEATLPDGSGFDLCRRLREDPAVASAAIVFLAEDASPEAKILAISAGADEYLAKPLYVKEILARLRALVERRQNEAFSRPGRPATFNGTLAGMGLVDLFQLIETGRKSCVLRVTTDRARSGGFTQDSEENGRLFFKDGQLIDAETSRLRGERATYRMFLWDDGSFELDFNLPARQAVIDTPTQALLLEGMRRVDEWSRITPSLPALSTRLAVDYRRLSARAAELPEEVEQVLNLFDGRRTILDVIDETGLDDLATLQVISRLLLDGVLQDKGARPGSKVGGPALEAWLTKPEPSPESELPTALQMAMIPSADTASQILAALEPLGGLPQIPVTALPEPILDESSAVLSRTTVPATSGVISRAVPPASAPEPAPQPSEGRLTVRRFGSSISPPPILPAPIPAAPLPPLPEPRPNPAADLAPPPMPPPVAPDALSFDEADFGELTS